jgi:hypothetical protein
LFYFLLAGTRVTINQLPNIHAETQQKKVVAITIHATALAIVIQVAAAVFRRL